MLKIAPILLFLLHLTIANAQDDFSQNLDLTSYSIKHSSKELVFGFSIGTHIELGNRRNGTWRIFVSGSLLKCLANSVSDSSMWGMSLGGQTELEVFRGGLGAPLANEGRAQFQIEIRNSIHIITGSSDLTEDLYLKPAMVNVSSNKSPLYDPYNSGSISLGTMFINGINHNRHQQIGIGTMSIGPGQIFYYNDATPFGKMWLADRYDRYWTGGGGLGFYGRLPDAIITSFEARYDNYTGYQRNLYETTGLLKLDNLSYKNKYQQMFNQARFEYRLVFKGQTSLNLSVYEPKVTDIQNLIHYNISHSPFHARPLTRRVTVGADFIYRELHE